MYQEFIDEILKHNDDVLLICLFEGTLHGYSGPDDMCELIAYIAAEDARPAEIYLDGRVKVWFYHVSLCLEVQYPRFLYDWAAMDQIIYCVDKDFSVDFPALFLATLPNALWSAQHQVPTREEAYHRFAYILQRYKETGVLDYKLESLPVVDNIETILYDPYFKKFKCDYVTLLEFQGSIINLLKYKGGYSMFTDYTIQSLDYLLTLHRGEKPEPITATPTDADVGMFINYAAQIIDVQSKEFETLLSDLNISPTHVTYEVLQKFHSLCLDFFNEINREYLDYLFAADIPNLAIRKSIYDMCTQYILRSGQISDYPEYLTQAITLIKDPSVDRVVLFELE